MVMRSSKGWLVFAPRWTHWLPFSPSWLMNQDGVTRQPRF